MGSTTIVRTELPVSVSGQPAHPPREEVRKQLARLLASSLFQHSKHYPALLRYVVNETLDGRGGFLKERALGVEVFGRDPDYDSNADPVVRTSACEVRKRIAQYYHEPGHELEIRIDLASGSYTPEFRYAPPGSAALPSPPVAVRAGRLAGLREFVRPQWVRVAGASVAVAALGLGAAVGIPSSTSVERFRSEERRVGK